MEDTVSGDYTYKMGDGGCIITKYTGSDSNVVIPATLDGKPVKTIGSSAFSGNDNLTSVIIPDTVEAINNYAFRGCKKLNSIKLGTKVKSVGYETFGGCEGLNDVYMYSPDAKLNAIGLEDAPYVTIYGIAGSTSQEYAAKYNIQFVPIEGDTLTMYRLYNRYRGEHFYTASAGERDTLVVAGWAYEDVAWIAPKSSATPIYRLYNPNATGAGSHHYTTDDSEKSMLISIGWEYEGIGWYGN